MANYCCSELVTLVKDTTQCERCDVRFCDECMDKPENYLICGCVAGTVDKKIWDKEKRATRTSDRSKGHFINWLCKPCTKIVGEQLGMPGLEREKHR